MTTQASKLTAVDDYIAKSKPFAQPILQFLRDLVHEASPGMEEAIKWSHPFFVYKGIIVANMAAFKEHCSFGLWGDETMNALRADGVATGGSMGSFGRITSLQDLPTRKKFTGYVRDAVKKIDEGTRTRSLTPRVLVAKPPAEVPEVLSAALAKNQLAASKFNAMSPSCRREYCEWIGSAKREETRAKRLNQAMEWIAAGKDRNWKYQPG
jgi:uncharacterized protein YdeI (YjbR/CyaY-like superfamily)